jgi:hypothetical protein
MANPIGDNGTHYRQERYVDQIVPLYRKELNIRADFMTDYEGSPVAGAVKVPVRDTDPTIGNYDVKTGGALSQSATTYTTIAVDTDIFVNELCDSYEAACVPDNMKAQRIEAGAYALGLNLEGKAITELETYGTKESSTTALTNENAYTSIKNSVVAIKKLGVDVNLIRVKVSADTEALLMEDAKFANSAGTLGADLLRSGVIGKIAGAQVKPSYNMGATTEYMVYATPWCQAGEEFRVGLGFKDLTNEYIGSSALQGRVVPFQKLTKTTACRVKTKATVSL